jgi:formate dehydrogenase subunit gamma
VHTVLYVATAVLLLSGVAVVGEGVRGLEALFGGHAATARAHRYLGFALVAVAAALVALRPRACGRFLVESFRFRSADRRWFASYLPFLLRPSQRRPARHEGHFDPGQRLYNLLVVVSLVVLAATGVVMSFPKTFTPDAFAWSLRIHRAATWILMAAVIAHLALASGVTRAYRGAWRAMHGDGRVPRELAEKLWPRWAEENPSRPPAGDGLIE